MNQSKHRSCDGKFKYHSEFHGIKALKNQITDGKIKIYDNEVYKCKHCEFWHIGHRSRKEAEQIENYLKYKKRPVSPLIRIKT